MTQIGKRKLKTKKRRSQEKDIIHILITATIRGQQQAEKIKNAYELLQAAQPWSLEVAGSPFETGPFALRRFLLLSKRVFVQLATILMELETRKG
jgi:hypothetical protein